MFTYALSMTLSLALIILVILFIKTESKKIKNNKNKKKEKKDTSFIEISFLYRFETGEIVKLFVELKDNKRYYYLQKPSENKITLNPNYSVFRQSSIYGLMKSCIDSYADYKNGNGNFGLEDEYVHLLYDRILRINDNGIGLKCEFTNRQYDQNKYYDKDSFYRDYYNSVERDENTTPICEHLKFFNLDATATFEQCKKRYYEYAKMYHPDNGGSEEKMKKVNSNYSKIKEYFEK